MADIEYRVIAVRRAYRYRAMRGAVFFPLFGANWLRRTPEESLSKLRRMWYKRIRSLKKAGWARLPDELATQYMRNCPPFGVITKSSARCCNVALLCPFCYARRYVLESFLAVERVLYGGTDPAAKPAPGWNLVEFRRPSRCRRRTCRWSAS
jgi:hypothetical protein